MRIMHTMLRVKSLDDSLNFYCNVLGMKVHSKTDVPEGKFTLAFIGYEDMSEGPALELTYNWGTETGYDLGDGYGHIAIGVEDAYKTCEEIKNRGGKIVREAGPMKGGKTVIAFAEDPDGYKVEIIQENTFNF
eukprot:gb/GECH01012165.1/.p1 GENE.gb/GECH01012165.1/~~gb/GECH01012165.1/.p1  ORF type:complete len:133 (+),score=36.06 gb/GECH01012165.1/:1-399(+)